MNEKKHTAAFELHDVTIGELVAILRDNNPNTLQAEYMQPISEKLNACCKQNNIQADEFVMCAIFVLWDCIDSQLKGKFKPWTKKTSESS